jgi:hypothetical protein
MPVLRTSGFLATQAPRPDGRGYFNQALRASRLSLSFGKEEGEKNWLLEHVSDLAFDVTAVHMYHSTAIREKGATNDQDTKEESVTA